VGDRKSPPEQLPFPGELIGDIGFELRVAFHP
jgi:hypothetical protein